jgi:hypothetical protein
MILWIALHSVRDFSVFSWPSSFGRGGDYSKYSRLFFEPDEALLRVEGFRFRTLLSYILYHSGKSLGKEAIVNAPLKFF